MLRRLVRILVTNQLTQSSLTRVFMSANPPLLSQRFRGYFPVVIDVETAGFNAGTDALLELAAVTVKMDENGFH